jgi:hypothetical protein
MTDYHYQTLLICVDKAAGNGLANIAASFPDDPGAELGTFTDERRVALADAPSVPVGWYAEIPSKSSMAGAIEALKAGADYSDERLAYLRERGMTAEQWAAAGATFVAADVYDASSGYQPNAMAALAAANGYQVIVQEESE